VRAGKPCYWKTQTSIINFIELTGGAVGSSTCIKGTTLNSLSDPSTQLMLYIYRGLVGRVRFKSLTWLIVRVNGASPWAKAGPNHAGALAA
jgi:hypothetical protein